MPGRVVVQWDKDDCADLGIIKVDLLGLGMMAVLEDTIHIVRDKYGEEGLQQFLREKCAPVAGDVTDQLFGLTEEQIASFTGRLACVINCAGLVTFVTAGDPDYATSLAILKALPAALPEGAHFTAPRGGVNIWIELPPRWSALELLNYAAQAGVLFMPGAPFYPAAAAQNTLRISFGTLPEDEASEAMTRFGRAARAYAAARRKRSAGGATDAAISAAV